LSSEDPQTILSRVEGRTIEGVAEQGIRGVLLSLFYHAVAIITGFMLVAEAFFEGVAGGIQSILTAFLEGVASVLQLGAEQQELLNIANTGFLESIVIAGAALLLLALILDQLDADVPFPGLTVIPFVGDSTDEDE
jgi:branched-subunit amino acid ABC-type transport system permease component